MNRNSTMKSKLRNVIAVLAALVCSVLRDAAAQAPEVILGSTDIHAGAIVEAELTSDSVMLIPVSDILEHQSDPASGDLKPGLLPPQDDHFYLIVTVDLKDGRTIGRYDYELVADGDRFNCLAMAPENDVFDPRKWQYAASGEDELIRLLYEIPRALDEVSLAMALPVGYPLPDVNLTLGAKQPKNEAEAGAAAAPQGPQPPPENGIAPDAGTPEAAALQEDESAEKAPTEADAATSEDETARNEAESEPPGETVAEQGQPDTEKTVAEPEKADAGSAKEEKKSDGLDDDWL